MADEAKYTDPGGWNLSWPDWRIKAWHNERGLPWGNPFEGPEPITVSKMVPTRGMNMTVHLANEHGLREDHYMGTSVAHLLAHVHGQFRPGQGHYHAQSGRHDG